MSFITTKESLGFRMDMSSDTGGQVGIEMEANNLRTIAPRTHAASAARVLFGSSRGIATAHRDKNLFWLCRVATEEDEVNALEVGTVLPIHRHPRTTETMVLFYPSDTGWSVAFS